MKVKCATPAHNDPGHGLNPDPLIQSLTDHQATVLLTLLGVFYVIMLLACKVQLE